MGLLQPTNPLEAQAAIVEVEVALDHQDLEVLLQVDQVEAVALQEAAARALHLNQEEEGSLY